MIGSCAAYSSRWLAMLESEEVKPLRKIAEIEGVDKSDVSRMVNLTNLATKFVEPILDDALPEGMTLFDVVVK
jgi:hypothetical protein